MTRKISEVSQKLRCMEQVREFPLMTALMGRRSRRVAKGANIDAGPFKFRSKQPVEPLSDFERAMITTTMIGNTGWSHLIPSNKKYAPYLPDYAGSAAGHLEDSLQQFLPLIASCTSRPFILIQNFMIAFINMDHTLIPMLSMTRTGTDLFNHEGQSRPNSSLLSVSPLPLQAIKMNIMKIRQKRFKVIGHTFRFDILWAETSKSVEGKNFT